ncbi:MAG: hypothetical protein QXE81_02415 [Desulfurococcaceae archaeon]
MSCVLKPNAIVIKGLVSHWEVKRILDKLNETLLPRNYGLLYYFEGSPCIEEGGMIVTIELTKELAPEDMVLIRKLMEINGLKVLDK